MNGIEQSELRQPRAHRRIHARVFDHRAGEQQAGFPSDIGVRVGQCNDGRAAVTSTSSGCVMEANCTIIGMSLRDEHGMPSRKNL